MHGALPPLGRLEDHVRVNLPFEAFEEPVTCRLGTRSPVGRTAPGDFGGYLLVET